MDANLFCRRDRLVRCLRARVRRCATLVRSQTMRPMVLARAQQRQPLCAAAGHALGWYGHFGSLDVERVSARAVRS